MQQQTEKPPSLADTLPEFGTELRQLLVSKPEDGFGPGNRNVRLFPEDGALLVLVDGKIACVELLDREDVRKKTPRDSSLR